MGAEGGPRRVGIAGFEHETNTFRPGATTLADVTIQRGDELLVERGRRTYAGGMFDGIDEIGATAVPLVIAGAQPSGPLERDAYRSLRDEIVAVVAGAGLDAVVLQLHGAAVAEGVDDVETDLGAAIRSAVGPDVAVVGSLDLHANLTPATLAPYDALTCVTLYPHTDMYDRGREAVRWLGRWFAGERFATHVERLPWLLMPTATDVPGPAAALELCDAAESEPGVLDATFVHGFPLADGPAVGASVLVTTVAAQADPVAIARRLAERIWSLRDGFDVDMHDPATAVALALDTVPFRGPFRGPGNGPVVLAETSDNPGGGGVGDGTHLLRALLDAGASGLFGSILDPVTAAAAHRAGTGATIEVSLGGRLDPSSGAPIEATAQVRALSDGRYELRGVGWQIDLGASALLRIDGVDVVVTSASQQVFDDGPFTIHGVDVRTAPLVALKSANHFRAYYRRIARSILPVLGPGLSAQTTSLPWERLQRPIWPLDPETTYP